MIQFYLRSINHTHTFNATKQVAKYSPHRFKLEYIKIFGKNLIYFLKSVISVTRTSFYESKYESIDL